MGEKVERLKQHLYRYHDVNSAASVLSWDQEVNMPPGGAEGRAEQMATLSAIAHELFVSEETGRLLEEAEAEVKDIDYQSDDASLVRVIRREYEKMTKIPTELVAEFSRTTSRAFVAWREARQADDYRHFQPHLQRILDLSHRFVEILGYEEEPYDALLDFYEPGMKTSQIRSLFGELKQGLLPLLRRIQEEGEKVETDFLHRTYPVERQWDLTEVILRKIGYDFTRGRQDKAPHPFTTEFSHGDVRVTTRLYPDFPQAAIFGSIHEGGHALYEQGIPAKFARTHLGHGATLGLHESQSRLWENMVGRSRAFWHYFLPIMQAFFPKQLMEIDLDHFYRAINEVKPDLIRVEADEVTYNFHIFIRFELEQALINGELDVADVPEAWNAKYNDYLGITPPSDANGCLQDVHWSHGTIGYFPTYTLGNLISAQLFERAREEIAGLEESFAEGEFKPLLDWLREHVHSHGAKFTAPELMAFEFGETIRAQPLITYLTEKYSDIYRL